jgi:hypothetical protein
MDPGTKKPPMNLLELRKKKRGIEGRDVRKKGKKKELNPCDAGETRSTGDVRRHV